MTRSNKPVTLFMFFFSSELKVVKEQLGREYFFLIHKINTGRDIVFSEITTRRREKKKK